MKLSNEQLQREVMLNQLGPRTSHILHLLLSVVTLGLWLPVWLLISISNSVERREARHAAEHGVRIGVAGIIAVALIVLAVVIAAPSLVTVAWVAFGGLVIAAAVVLLKDGGQK